MCIFKTAFITSIIGSALLFLTAGTASAKTVVIPLDEASFTSPTAITNPYWPLPMGSTFTYFTETEDGCEYNQLTVTSDTYDVTVDGIVYTTRVLRDQEWVHEPEEGEECDPAAAELEEDTLDYYAQDDDGNIWYFGEDTWSKDDEGSCVPDGAWEAGVDDAEPGVVMLAKPKSGLRYQQEYWEGEAEDWGAVLRLNAKVAIDYMDSTFEGCLMTREWTPLEPGHIEHKFYCPQEGDMGPGLMFIEELKEKTVYVEYAGPGPVGADGENSPEFPSDALGCDEDE